MGVQDMVPGIHGPAILENGVVDVRRGGTARGAQISDLVPAGDPLFRTPRGEGLQVAVHSPDTIPVIQGDVITQAAVVSDLFDHPVRRRQNFGSEGSGDVQTIVEFATSRKRIRAESVSRSPVVSRADRERQNRGQMSTEGVGVSKSGGKRVKTGVEKPGFPGKLVEIAMDLRETI